MAEARQKEIKDSMTVVATNTRTAGRLVSVEVLMHSEGRGQSSRTNYLKIA
jgi:hypothetical protein